MHFTGCAQSTTTFGKTYNIENADNLSHSLNGNVEIKETKSNRVYVECTVTVKHAKSNSIVSHIVSNNLLSTDVSYDNSTRTVKLDTPELKPMIVDKSDVEVSTSYIVHVPAHIKILQ
jgi:hypothetical protein